MINQEDILAIGKFQKTHALKGELNALLDIDPEYVELGNAMIVETDGIYVPFFASSIRQKGNTSFLVKLEGIDSEAEAKEFVNKTIYGLRSDLAQFLDVDQDEILGEDSFDGFEVIDAVSGESIGRISRIDSATENLLFVVETDDEKEIFIPAVEDFIDHVDDDDKKIFMTLPDGLVDLNN